MTVAVLDKDELAVAEEMLQGNLQAGAQCSREEAWRRAIVEITKLRKEWNAADWGGGGWKTRAERAEKKAADFETALEAQIQWGDRLPYHPTDRVQGVLELLERAKSALSQMLKAHEQLMPCVKNNAVQDYAILNEAPIAARAVLKEME